jgi:hypothetical protein
MRRDPGGSESGDAAISRRWSVFHLGIGRNGCGPGDSRCAYCCAGSSHAEPGLRVERSSETHESDQEAHAESCVAQVTPANWWGGLIETARHEGTLSADLYMLNRI